MHFLLLGLLLLIVVVLIAHRTAGANAGQILRQLRIGCGVVLLAASAAFAVRGLGSYAGPMALVGTWLLWGRGLPTPMGGPGGGWGGQSRSSGQTSKVQTETLELELDHDTGQMTGRILAGMFEGRRIESLKPAEMALLWQDCRFNDPQSAQIIAAYLDQTHPTWREDVARGEERMSGGPDGRMTMQEAYEILGLKPGASDDDIRNAHRELMLKLHPDRGGSTYLATKINEAKDVLLGGKG